MKTNFLKTVCGGIAGAMGVAVVVTNIINPISLADLANLQCILKTTNRPGEAPSYF